MKVKDALNLWAGSSFNRLVQIKDPLSANVSSMLAGRIISLSQGWSLAMPRSPSIRPIPSPAKSAFNSPIRFPRQFWACSLPSNLKVADEW